MNAIEITNLDFAYQGGPKVLCISNLQIKKGEKVFLRGPSGSGKTTLLNIMGGILSYDKGDLQVLGKNLKTLSASEKDQFRADHLGIIFQTLHLIPYLSPLENILLPLQFSAKKQQTVNAFELETLLQNLRLDKTEMETKKTYQLSLGQQQRVAVARALIGKPEIIIADEPTSSIDSEARDRFLQLLFRNAIENHTTIIFVSHDASLSTYFDRSLNLQMINQVKRREDEIF